jgi:ABC-2 type transport system ATP-binding protein
VLSPPAEAPPLRACAISRRFGERVALRELDLELRVGELLAIIGPNGAGKTTLLSILAGALEPSSGEILWAGGRLPGWVPQQPALYSKLSVAENLRLFARLERLPDVEGAVARMLAQAGLADRAAEPVGRLSGGNQQRVNIAIGLLAAPAVVLLDEPTAALDPRQRERLWRFIGSLARGGTTVAYSTHNVLEAERYADRVLVLVDGELLFTGTPAELRAEAIAAALRLAADERHPGAAQGADFESAFLALLHARGH